MSLVADLTHSWPILEVACVVRKVIMNLQVVEAVMRIVLTVWELEEEVVFLF